MTYPIYVSLEGTKLNSFILANAGITPDGGVVKMTEYSPASRDMGAQVYGGRSPRSYSMELHSADRDALEDLIGEINSVEELAEFTPFTSDRITFVKRASAALKAPQQTGGVWYYMGDCKIYTYDSLMYSSKTVILDQENYTLTSATTTVENEGTYKSGLDMLSLSGYFDGSDYTEDVDLLIAGSTIRLIDSMLHGDLFEVNRFGKITHSFYTDFDLTMVNLQKYLNGVGTLVAATAGYHLGGKSPMTNIVDLPSDQKGGYIQVDSEAERSYFSLTTKSTDNSAAKIAADMQAAIRTLGGAYAAVTVELTSDGRFKITSGTTGVNSKVRITDADAEKGDYLVWYLNLCSGDEFSWSYDDHPKWGRPKGTDIDGVGGSTPTVYSGVDSPGYHVSGSPMATVITGAGFHLGGTGAATSLSKTGTKLKVQCDSHADAHEITLSLASCTSATTTAAELQAKIRAIHADFAAIVVRYEFGRYLIISGTTGSSSKIRITDGDTNNVANTLRLGTSWGGVNVDGWPVSQAAHEAGGIAPSTNLSGGTDTDFKIQNDAASAASVVSLTKASCTTGALTAAEMQTKIRALGTVNGAAYGAVTVSYQGAPISYGKEQSGLNPSIDISGGTDTDFKIQADAASAASTISLTKASCTTGALTAAEMQTKIRALGTVNGANYSNITVAYVGSAPNNYYLITSGTNGAASKIRITNGTSNNVADNLKIGAANGATDTDGVASSDYYLITSGIQNSSAKVRITNADSASCAAALKIGAANGATDTDASGLDSLNIQADSEASPSAIFLTLSGLNTGALIAAQLQTKIRALGGAYDNVTAVYNNGTYIITSETAGSASKIRITSAASNDVAVLLQLGTANGGTNTDGITTGTISKNVFLLGKYGMLTVPMSGPIPVYGAPFIEFTATAITGTPKAFWCLTSDMSQRNYISNEIIVGYNKLYFPDLQCGSDIWFGLYADANSSITLYDLYAECRRDIPRAALPTVEPGEDCVFGLTAAGSGKVSSVEMSYRNAFWS